MKMCGVNVNIIFQKTKLINIYISPLFMKKTATKISVYVIAIIIIILIVNLLRQHSASLFKR